MSIEGLEEKVLKVCAGWGLHNDVHATDRTRFNKIEEEVRELEEAIFKKKDPTEIKMEGGDVLITLINALHMKGLTLEQCLLAAYLKIKNRSGKMVAGSYVKEADLPTEP